MTKLEVKMKDTAYFLVIVVCLIHIWEKLTSQWDDTTKKFVLGCLLITVWCVLKAILDKWILA